MYRLQVESEGIRKMLQALEAEKEHYIAKQNSSQELVWCKESSRICWHRVISNRVAGFSWMHQLARMKSECMMLRTKLKDVETDYRTLQAKHR